MRDTAFHRIRTRPMAEGTLSRLASARARAAGIDVVPLMAKAGVTRRQVEEEDVWLPAEGQIKFVELIADALPDDLLGFHIACDVDLREIGLLYYVLNSSDLLGDAFRRAERYCAIINEGVRVRVREGKELALDLKYVGLQRLSDRHQIEFWVTRLVHGCRKMTGHRLLPSYVGLVHRRKGGASELVRFLGCDVEFGADTDEVAFPGTVEQMPVVSADPYLNKLLIKYCEEARSHSAHALRLGTRDALLVFHRAMIERCLGAPSARSWFRRALTINPNFSFLWAPVARKALETRP